MIPEYCFDCMNRQMPANNMNYMNPMMNAAYQQPMQVPYTMQQTAQMPIDASQQQMQQVPYMQPGIGAQPIQQFPTMQPGTAAQPMQQFSTMQPMAPVEGGPDFQIEPGPPVATDINYTQAYLRTKIGQRVKIEFLIGTNMLIDREGTLLEVGVSYVIIREIDTDDELLCDIYSIKFVRFYY